MVRRRSRAKKSIASSDGSTNARALQTLPSAVSTQRLARTQSKISELLDHAHQHVELAMQLCDGEHADDDWPSMADTARTRSATEGTKPSMAVSLLRVLLRKKKRVARLVDLSGSATSHDARYGRLKHGYSVVTQHLKDTDASRQHLENALGEFRKQALAMESVLPPESRDSRVMMTSLVACFAQSASLVDEIVAVLSHDVAEQTQTKMNQLAAFKDTLERRERLFVDTEIAKQQLDQFHKLKLKHRSAIPGAYDLELAQRKHEYAVLRRRLATLTAAVEHVFQFHTHLDHCVVDPEMATTHHQLTRLFEKQARVFEKNVK